MAVRTECAGGMYFGVYAKKQYLTRFNDIASCSVKVSGKTANVIRFNINDTSFCFVNAHLHEGKTPLDVTKRQAMVKEIAGKAFKAEREFRYKNYDLLEGHDVKVISGCLNFS